MLPAVNLTRVLASNSLKQQVHVSARPLWVGGTKPYPWVVHGLRQEESVNLDHSSTYSRDNSRAGYHPIPGNLYAQRRSQPQTTPGGKSTICLVRAFWYRSFFPGVRWSNSAHLVTVHGVGTTTNIILNIILYNLVHSLFSHLFCPTKFGKMWLCGRWHVINSCINLLQLIGTVFLWRH